MILATTVPRRSTDAAAIVVNYFASVGIELLPDGHKELYFYLGLLVACVGSWWTGLYDRP